MPPVNDPTGFSTTGQKTVMLMMEPDMLQLQFRSACPHILTTVSIRRQHASEADMLTDPAESLQALAGVVESAAAVPVEPMTATEILEHTQHVEENSEAMLTQNSWK